MDATDMRRRLDEARVGHLATADATGKPHVVPVTFALDGDTLYFAVDAKPKRTTDLKRLRNIASNPRVALLVDHYADDWTRLWWVRVDGRADLAGGTQAARAVEVLAAKYAQARRQPPTGPVVAISIEQVAGWSYRDAT